MSHKSQRLSWRARCRRWQCYINALLAVLVALVLATTPALAAPACPGGDWTSQGCVYVVRGRLAVWPVQWGAKRYAVTIDPEAQP